MSVVETREMPIIANLQCSCRHLAIRGGALVLLLLLPFCGTTSAAIWQSSLGSWFESQNWSSGGAPTARDNAQIDNSGTAQILASGAVAKDLYLSQGALVIGPAGTLSNGFTRIGIEGEFSVEVAGGSWTTTGINVGLTSTGSLTLVNNAAVSSGSMAIGSSEGSLDSLLVFEARGNCIFALGQPW
jgi:hypothetical protein